MGAWGGAWGPGPLGRLTRGERGLDRVQLHEGASQSLSPQMQEKQRGAESVVGRVPRVRGDQAGVTREPERRSDLGLHSTVLLRSVTALHALLVNHGRCSQKYFRCIFRPPPPTREIQDPLEICVNLSGHQKPGHTTSPVPPSRHCAEVPKMVSVEKRTLVILFHSGWGMWAKDHRFLPF